MVPASEPVELQVVGLRLIARPCEPPRRVARPRLLAGLSWREERYTAVSLLGYALLVFVLLSVPPEARSLAAAEPLAAHRVLLPAAVTAEARPRLPEAGSWITAAGGAAAGPVGEAGTKDAPRQDGAYGIKRRKLAAALRPGRPARTEAEPVRPTLGIVDVLARDERTLASVLARESALGAEALNALGHLQGRAIADAHGSEGLGRYGTSVGAGCHDDASCTGAGLLRAGGLGRMGPPSRR